jgi:WD40 repeat protein
MSTESKAEATHDQSPSPRAPWLGLRSYDEAARGYFYGREREVQELYQSVCEHRLSVLFGRSGLGKTSLLRAGLLPRLRAEGRRGVLIRLRFDDEAATLVQQVRDELHAVLRPELEPEAEVDTDLLERPLWQLAHQDHTRSALEFLRPVLIFDQFEEVFSLGAGSDDAQRKRRDRRSEVETLLFELADLIEDREPASLRERLRSERDFAAAFSRGEHPLRVLITLREDYLHQLERWRRTLPSLMRQRIELLALRGPEALDVVLKPARKRALPLLETDVAERIVRIAAKAKADTPIDWIEAVPPLLSQLCFELNEMRLKRAGDSDTSQIEASDVQQDAANVLKHYYQRCLHGRPKGVAQAIEFLLIDDGGRIREASSQDTVLSQMRGYGVEQPESELEQLIDLRLLTREERGGAPRIELTHDSLVEVVAEARNAREAEERAEAERVEAERRAMVERERLAAAELATRKAKVAQRRARLVSVAMAVLFLLALIGGWQAWERTQLARLAARKAQLAEAKSQAVIEHAAHRALARARENLDRGDTVRYAIDVAESISHVPELAQRDAALLILQSPSPQLTHQVKNPGAFGRFLSPDRTRLVTTTRKGEARLWKTSDAMMMDTGISQLSVVNHVAFSSDSKSIVTSSGPYSSGPGFVQLWSAETGAPVRDPWRATFGITESVFFPGDSKIATAGPGAVAILNTESGANELQFNPGSSASGIGVTPDGKFLFLVTQVDGVFRLHRTETGESIQLPPKGSDIYFLSFSKNGNRMITVDRAGVAYVWDAQSGIAVTKPLHHESIGEAPSIGIRPVQAYFLDDAGSRFITKYDSSLNLWDTQASGRLIAKMQHDASINFVDASPDGALVMTGSADSVIRLWDSQTGTAMSEDMRHDGEINHALFGFDGRRIASSASDRFLRFWTNSGELISKVPVAAQGIASILDRKYFHSSAHDVTAGYVHENSAIYSPMRHTSRVDSARFARDGTSVITVGDDEVKVWSVETEALLKKLSFDKRYFSKSVDQEATLALTTDGESAHLWELKTGALIGSVPGFSGELYTAEFAPDGESFLTLDGGIVQAWDAKTLTSIGKRTSLPATPDCKDFFVGYNSAIVFNSTGSQALIFSSRCAQVWSASKGLIGSPVFHGLIIEHASISHDNSRVITSSQDRTSMIIDMATGGLVAKLEGHQYFVNHAEFSRDGTRIVTASSDNTAQIWDGVTFKPIGEPILHTDSVDDASFSPDGSMIVTSTSNLVQLYDVKSGLRMGLPILHSGEISTVELSDDGNKLLTASADGSARLWDITFDIPADQLITPKDVLIFSGQTPAATANTSKSITAMNQLELVLAWHFTDPATRTISPFSQITVPQHIEREIAWVLEHPQTEKPDGPNYSPKILDDAYNLDPGHPLILLALSVFEDRPETKALWKRLSFPRFEKDARLAARAAEILLIDKDPENARKAAEIAMNLPNATNADKAKAGAVIAQIDGNVTKP